MRVQGSPEAGRTVRRCAVACDASVAVTATGKAWALWRRAAVSSVFVLLAACSTTGQGFNAMALSKIVPGQTTFEQAQSLLGAAPVDIYDQGDGSLMARWAYKASVMTDAIYARQELLLMFDTHGRFQRVVDSVNVPTEPGKAVAPAVGGVAPGDAGVGRSRVQAVPPNPVADTSTRGIDNTVVTYPLGPQ
ncbi:MAG: hypothetical protein EPN76_00515 [Burkholderiaceae bacterium]|nr:MAG: hypothetical protein EPN76_00515 [Burkholderiaceae bacterium]